MALRRWGAGPLEGDTTLIYTLSGGQSFSFTRLLGALSSSSGNQTKFGPTYLLTSDTWSSAAAVASEASVMQKSGTNGTTYPGSPFGGYGPLYDWGYMEPNGGDYSTGLAIMANDFNVIQSACPGAQFAPQFRYAQYHLRSVSNGNAPWIPADILSNSAYGLGPIGTTNFGWAMSDYQGGGNFNVQSAAIWRYTGNPSTGVMDRWILFLQKMGNTPFLTTAGPYAGQTFTANTHPLFGAFIDATEYSWGFGATNGNPIPPADYTDAALTSAFKNELTQCKANLSQMQFMMFLSYGDSGPNAYTNLNTLVQWSATHNCSLSNADTYQNVSQINGQAFYTGSANGTGIPTPPDNRTIMGYWGNCQAPDYNGGNGADPAAALLTMWTVWSSQLDVRYIMLTTSDDGVHGGPATFVPTYLTPFANSHPIPNTSRPSNLP